MSDAPEPATDVKPSVPAEVTSRRTSEPLLRYYLAPGVVLILFGFWCFYESIIQGKYPHKPMDQDLNAWASWAFNYYCGFLLPIVGAALLACGVLVQKRVLIADNEGIGYAGKLRIPWSEIKEVDAAQLKKKGQARLVVADGTRILLEDWKQTNFRDLLAKIEAHVPPDQILR